MRTAKVYKGADWNRLRLQFDDNGDCKEWYIRDCQESRMVDDIALVMENQIIITNRKAHHRLYPNDPDIHYMIVSDTEVLEVAYNLGDCELKDIGKDCSDYGRGVVLIEGWVCCYHHSQVLTASKKIQSQLATAWKYSDRYFKETPFHIQLQLLLEDNRIPFGETDNKYDLFVRGLGAVIERAQPPRLRLGQTIFLKPENKHKSGELVKVRWNSTTIGTAEVIRYFRGFTECVVIGYDTIGLKDAFD